jgi:hypothetical protein
VDRWLEIPAWMFDRSACGRVRMAADAHVELSALATLAALLRGAVNDGLASSNAPVLGVSSLSGDQNRREIHATPKTDTGAPPRAAANRPVRKRIAGLPPETQAALTKLMTRLILDYADKNRIGSTREGSHDL